MQFHWRLPCRVQQGADVAKKTIMREATILSATGRWLKTGHGGASSSVVMDFKRLGEGV